MNYGTTENEIRYAAERSGKKDYTIIDGQAYEVMNLKQRQIESLFLTQELEKIVHGENSENVISIRQLDGGYVAKKIPTDSRDLWHLNDKSKPFVPEVNSYFLKEFLVDYLMGNVSLGYSAFALSSDNTIVSTGYKTPFANISKFILPDGTVDTKMSYDITDNDEYTYNSSNDSQNVYKNVFESYINSNDKNKLIPPEAFEEMRKIAEKIHKMPEDEYMKLFEGLINSDFEANREGIKRVIIARKNSILDETDAFIESLGVPIIHRDEEEQII